MSQFTISRSQKDYPHVPWVVFMFLAILFFIIQHNLYISTGSFAPDTNTIIESVLEGSLKRRIALILLGLFGVISLFQKSRYVLRINRLLGWLILFFLVWAFSSLAWADNTALTFRKLVVLAMLCFGALAVSKSFSLRDIILFAFFSTSLYLIIGISTELALGTFQPLVPGYRFAGTLHPNLQGVNCAVLLLASVSLAGSAKRGNSFFLVAAVIVFIFLVLTRSRTAFAGAMLAFFAYWAMKSSTSHKLALILSVSLTFCFILLLVGVALFPILKQGVLLGRENPTTYTLSGRIPLWKECLEYFGRRPFLGYGYNSFWTPRHIDEISSLQGWGVGEVHSAYLDILLGVGLIGALAYVLILLVGIRRSFVFYRTSRNTAYAFFGVLLIFCVLDGILESGIVHPTSLTFLSYVVLAHLAFKGQLGSNRKTLP